MFTGALLFDFDGLLVDTESAALRAWQETFREHGAEIPPSAWHAVLGTQHTKAAMLALLGRRKDELDLRATWLTVKARIVALLEDEGPRAGVVTYLDTARERGLRLAVASGATRDWVVPRLRDVGLLHAFDAVGEAAFAGPELAADLVHDEAGLLGYLAPGGVLELLAGVLAAAGEFPPVVAGVVGVAGVDEQDFVVAVEEQDAGADPQGRFSIDGHLVVLVVEAMVLGVGGRRGLEGSASHRSCGSGTARESVVRPGPRGGGESRAVGQGLVAFQVLPDAPDRDRESRSWFRRSLPPGR